MAARKGSRRRKKKAVRRRKRPKLTFGLELETVGRTRLEVARALNIEFGGYLEVWSDLEYDEQKVVGKVDEHREDYLLHFGEKGRRYRWEVVDDDSIQPEDGDLRRAEVVLGPLQERDLPLISRACKTLLIAGCRTNESCGVHVHFSSESFDGRSLRRLIALVYMYEPILFRALNVSEARKEKHAKPVHEGFAREVLSANDEPLTSIHKWYEYGGRGMTTGRFDPVRAYGLNLNPEPLENHYELRYFNGTLDPDTALAYVHLAVGMLRYALRKAPPPTLTDAVEFRHRILADTGSHHREFARLLKAMGLGSSRFRRTRDLFLKNL